MKTLLFWLLMLLGPGTASARAQEAKLLLGHCVKISLSEVSAKDVAQVNGFYTVSSSGTLKLCNLAEKIEAANLTPTELQKKIENAFESAQVFPGAKVSVEEPFREGDNIPVVINGGEVQTPGEIQLKGTDHAFDFEKKRRHNQTRKHQKSKTYS